MGWGPTAGFFDGTIGGVPMAGEPTESVTAWGSEVKKL